MSINTMGRPLGIRSKPYAAVSTTADEEADQTELPPISPTIYQDESGLSFEQDEEDMSYESGHDDNDSNAADYDDEVATQSLDLQQQLETSESQSNERCIRVKFVVLFSFLAAIVIFGKEYYNSNGGSKITSDEFDLEEYIKVRDPAYYNNGVRGKNSSNDTTNNSTVEEEGVIICQDDPEFMYNNTQHPKQKAKSCAEYVGNIDKANLLKIRCDKRTGIKSSDDDAAAELLIKDFCKQSCGLCQSNAIISGGNDFSQDDKDVIMYQIELEVGEGMLEVLGEEEELASKTKDEEDLMDEDQKEELEIMVEEDAEFLAEDIEELTEKIVEAEADDDGVLAEEKKEYIDALEEELHEDNEMQSQVETLEEKLSEVESLEEQLDEVTDVNEDQDQDEEVEVNSNNNDDDDDDDEIPDYFVPLTPGERALMKDRLRETLLKTKNALKTSATEDNQRTFVLGKDSPKQFMHMHHMKTGGTSVDGLIRCALKRQEVLHNGTSISYSKMSECGRGVQNCMKTLADELNATLTKNVFYRNNDDGSPIEDSPFDPSDDITSINEMNVCKSSESNVMSYCASLHTVRTFGWKDVDKITVIRNPIDRAWSMYRFRLNRCYKCQELKDVLKQVHNGTFVSSDAPNFLYEPNNSCAAQLIGHQSTNLLSSVDLYNVANDVRFPMNAQIVEEAVRNLREEFTWIGLTDQLQASVEGFREIFPFLAENFNDATRALQEEFNTRGEELEDHSFSLPEGYSDDSSCRFEHRNAGRDPTCGTTELDDETTQWIMKLNSRDMAVYRAAVERFGLQMEVLQEYKEGNI